jgi:hypothetical protein
MKNKIATIETGNASDLANSFGKRGLESAPAT